MTFRSSGISIQRITKIDDEEILMLDLILVSDSIDGIWRSRTAVEGQKTHQHLVRVIHVYQVTDRDEQAAAGRHERGVPSDSKQFTVVGLLDDTVLT